MPRWGKIAHVLIVTRANFKKFSPKQRVKRDPQPHQFTHAQLAAAHRQEQAVGIVTQLTFDDALARKPHFDGETYDAARDQKRLNMQIRKVFDVVKDGKKHTIGEIAERVGAPEASVSARLRDLRKPKFGGHTVKREYVSRGLFQYQVIVNPSTESKP